MKIPSGGSGLPPVRRWSAPTFPDLGSPSGPAAGSAPYASNAQEFEWFNALPTGRRKSQGSEVDEAGPMLPCITGSPRWIRWLGSVSTFLVIDGLLCSIGLWSTNAAGRPPGSSAPASSAWRRAPPAAWPEPILPAPCACRMRPGHGGRESFDIACTCILSHSQVIGSTSPGAALCDYGHPGKLAVIGEG